MGCGCYGFQYSTTPRFPAESPINRTVRKNSDVGYGLALCMGLKSKDKQGQATLLIARQLIT